METINQVEDNSAAGQDLLKHAMKMGAILGAITIVLTAVVYAVDYTIMVNMWFGLFILFLALGYVIYAGITYRKEVGGYLSYGKAFQHSYVTLLTSAIIGSIFSLLLYTVIDTDLPAKLTDVAVENAESMMVKFGAPQEQIDKSLDEMRADMPARFSAIGVLKQLGWGLIIYAVISAITSLFVRKNVPEVL
jgi:hypothetical protein